MYRHLALHTPEDTCAAYDEITGDAEKFAYMMKICNFINSMVKGQWLEIDRHTKEANIPAFIKSVCVLYQYKSIDITFNNEFTKFRKE